MSSAPAHPAVTAVGDNPTPIWGMTNGERVRRIAAAQEAGAGALLVDLRYVFDPAWMRHVATRPGSVLTLAGAPVIAHVGPKDRRAMEAAMREGRPIPDLASIPAEDPEGIYDVALRKRERPFVMPLTPATVRAAEWASYQGAYKGVTDLLTKYLWPVWAFHLTRLAARIGATPNQVTALGTLLCAAAAVLFWHGWFWTGLAAGLAFMVLDTVDGKLARCTVTSSAIGNIWDHGIDLIHPPFWWWAWAVGCAPYGRPLGDEAFWVVMATMVGGYVLQRMIEGVFMRKFGGMHIHVWEQFDSRFRLITARRNPNMVILFASLVVGRPDWGIVAVAAWTLLSLLVHAVRLVQAFAARRRGPLVSWLA